MSHIDPHGLHYDERIADLTTRLNGARQRVNELESELEWWQRGRALYGHDLPPDDIGGKTTELVPSRDVLLQPGTKPTLAQAIVRVMKDGELSEWTPPQIMDALRTNGWMPKGSSAEHMVRTRLAQMARYEDGPLTRVRHGVYALNDSKSASLTPAEGP
jgi:hypothetical protein